MEATGGEGAARLCYGDCISLSCDGGLLTCDGLVKTAAELQTTPDPLDRAHSVFQVCYPMSYDVQRSSMSKRKPSTTKSHMTLLVEQQSLASRLKEEEEKNRRMLKENCGADFPLSYGNVVQLRHEKSDLYLSIESSTVAAKDPECIKCSLQHGSDASYFQLVGVFKIQLDGTSVFDGAQVKLLSCKLGDYLLHSTQNEVNLSSHDIKRHETQTNTSTRAPFHWTLALNRPHLENEDDYFCLGHPVYLFHMEAEAYICGGGDENLPPPPPSSPPPPLAGPPASLEIQTEATPQSQSLATSGAQQRRNALRLSPTQSEMFKSVFVFEVPGGPNSLFTRGGPVHWSQPYRIRHVASGYYLAQGTGENLNLVANPEQLPRRMDALFVIYPAQYGTDGNGPMKWSEVRIDGLRIATNKTKRWIRRPPHLKTSPKAPVVCMERYGSHDDALMMFPVQQQDRSEMDYVLMMIRECENFISEMQTHQLKDFEDEHLPFLHEFRSMLNNFVFKLKGLPKTRVQKIQDIARDLKCVDILMWAFQSPPISSPSLPVILPALLAKNQVSLINVIRVLISRNRSTQLYMSRQKFSTCRGFRGRLCGTARFCADKWVTALLQQLKFRVGVGSLLRELVHGNIQVLNSVVDTHFLQTFITFLKETGPYSQWLDFFSEVCECNGCRVPQQQEAILRLFLSVPTFSGEFEDERNKYNRAHIFLETIQDRSVQRPYKPLADINEVAEALQRKAVPDGLRHVVVPCHYAGQFSNRLTKTEKNGVVYFNVSSAAELGLFKEVIESGIAHLDRGMAYLGKQMYLEGLPRLLVGYSSLERGNIFSSRFSSCVNPIPNVTVTEEHSFVTTELLEGGEDGMNHECILSLKNIKEYHTSIWSPAEATDMEWFELKHLLWVLEPHKLHSVGGVELSTDAESLQEFQRQKELALYYVSQIKLLSMLCYGNNTRCTSVIKRLFPFELVFVGMSDEELPSVARTAFTSLMINLHVAVFPHTKLYSPNTIRLISDLDSDYVLGSGSALPHTAEHIMRRLRLLKFFSSNYFIELKNKSGVLTEDENQLKLAVTKLCRVMTDHGFYGTAKDIKFYLCNPLLGALDGRLDQEPDNDNIAGLAAPSTKAVSSHERYADNKQTHVNIQSKIEACNVLLSVASIRLDYRVSKLLHGWRFLKPDKQAIARLKSAKSQVQLSLMRSKVSPTPRDQRSRSVIVTTAATGALRKARLQAMEEAQAKKKTQAGSGSQVLQAMPELLDRSVSTGGQQLFDGMFQHFFHLKVVDKVESPVDRSVSTGGQKLLDKLLQHCFYLKVVDKPECPPTLPTKSQSVPANLDFELMTEAPFATIMLDLLMYKNSDLFHTAMTLLVRKYSTRAALRRSVSKMLVLVRPAMLQDYQNITRQLEELQHLMHSFPVWAMGNFPEDVNRPLEQEQKRDTKASQVNSLLDSLIDVGFAKDGSRSTFHQDMLQHCKAHVVVFVALHVRYRIAHDEIGARRTRIERHNEILAEVHSKSYKLLRVMTAFHQANQNILYDHLSFFVEQAENLRKKRALQSACNQLTRASLIDGNSMTVSILHCVGSIFEGNAELASKIPRKVLVQFCSLMDACMGGGDGQSPIGRESLTWATSPSSSVREITFTPSTKAGARARAEEIVYYRRFFERICVIDGVANQDIQLELLVLIADGAYSKLQCWINHEERSVLVQKFTQQNLRGIVNAMPSPLHQHVEMLRVCIAINTKANVQVHAKMNKLFSPRLLVAAICSSKTEVPVIMELYCKLLKVVYLESSLDASDAIGKPSVFNQLSEVWCSYIKDFHSMAGMAGPFTRAPLASAIFHGIFPSIFSYLAKFGEQANAIVCKVHRQNLKKSVDRLSQSKQVTQRDQIKVARVVAALDEMGSHAGMQGTFAIGRRPSPVPAATSEQQQLNNFVTILQQSHLIRKKEIQEFDGLVKAIEDVQQSTDPQNTDYLALPDTERNVDPRTNAIPADDLINRIVRFDVGYFRSLEKEGEIKLDTTVQATLKIFRRLIERKLDDPEKENQLNLLEPILPERVMDASTPEESAFGKTLTFQQQFREKLKLVLDSFSFLLLMILLVIASFVCSSSSMVEDYLGHNGVDSLTMVFGFLFLTEVVIRLWCVGLYVYFTDPICVVDFAVSAVDLVFFFGQRASSSGLDPDNANAARAGRMIRLVRLFRLSRFLRLAKKVSDFFHGKSEEQLVKQKQQEGHRAQQCSLADANVLELVLQAFAGDSVHPDMRLTAAELGYRMLEYGNTSTQDRLCGILTSHGSAMFQFCEKLFQSTTAELASMNAPPKQQKYILMSTTCRFLQSCCEGHHHMMQNIMREQSGWHSVNIVELAANVFCSLCDQEERAETVGFQECRLLEALMDFIIEVLQGPNSANQKLLAENQIVRVVCRLLGVRMRGVQEVAPKNSSGRFELQPANRRKLFPDSLTLVPDPLSFVHSAMSLKSKCCDFLCALIEGSTCEYTLSKVAGAMDCSVLKKRLEYLYLLQNYLNKNEVTFDEKQRILNRDCTQWEDQFRREGLVLLIFCKTLSQRNKDFTESMVIDSSDFVNGLDYFLMGYEEAIDEYYALHRMQSELDTTVRKVVTEPEEANANVDELSDLARSEEETVRQIFVTGSRMLRLLGVTPRVWRRFNTFSKLKQILSVNWKADYDELFKITRKIHDQAVMLRSWLFFDSDIRSCEICWNGELHTVFFPLHKDSQYLGDVQTVLLADLQTTTAADKIAQFVSRCKTQATAMPFNEMSDSLRIPVFGISLFQCVMRLSLLETASFLIASLNALVMLTSLEYDRDVVTSTNASVKYRSNWSRYLNRALGVVQLFICTAVAFFYLLKRFPFVVFKRFTAYSQRSQQTAVRSVLQEAADMSKAIMPALVAEFSMLFIVGAVVFERYGNSIVLFISFPAFIISFVLKCKEYCNVPESYKSLAFATLADLFLEVTTLFNFFLMCSCILGLVYWEFFYGAILLKAVSLFPAVANVVKAVYFPAKSLSLTFLLAAIFVYGFALWGFYLMPEAFAFNERSYCNTMSECFWFVLHMGFLSGAGLPGDGVLADDISTGQIFDYNDFSTSTGRMIFDLLFWIVVTICLLNCVFGIMLDTFASLRESNDVKEDQISNYCFICCLHRSNFPSHQAFIFHQEQEHNMLNYVNLILSVECAKATDRTGYQDYIHSQLEADDISWIPINKSMSLGKDGHEENNFDSIAGAIDSIRTELAAQAATFSDVTSNLQSQLTSLQGDLRQRIKANAA